MADVTLPRRATSARRTAMWAYARNHVFFLIACLVAVAYVLAAIFAPWVAPHAPTEQDMMAFMSPPAWGPHPLGTDSFGQDLLSRTIYGARYALAIGLGAVAIGAGGGLVIGMAAGLSGGFVEWALMRLIDSILAIPSLIMAIAFISILGQGVDKVILAVGLALSRSRCRPPSA
ncbi:MAG: peptide transporter permease [Xanthobacteraceae bacterium]|nr:peptide transporter permease [Xanthobacteraceae bacterium]